VIMKDKLIIVAKIISNTLNIATWFPFITIALLTKNHLTTEQLIIIIPTVVIFQLVIPLFYIYVLLLKKQIIDFDMSKKEERIKPLCVCLVCLLISLVVIYFFSSRFIFMIYALIFILLLVNALITLFWKISFHMGANTVGTLIINFLYGWQLPVLYVLLPLVFWSRLKLKKHTVAQLLGALLINSLIIFLFLKYSGLDH